MPPKRRPMRYAHCEGHTAVCYTQEGRYILTCGGDGDVRIWCGLEDDDPTSHCVGERALAVFCKDSQVFVGTDNNNVQIYTLPDMERDGVLTRFTAPVTHIAAVSGGNIVASGSCDMNIRIVNQKTSETVVLSGHKAPILGIALDPKEEFLASSSCDGTVRVWVIKTKEVVKIWNTLPLCNSFTSAKCLGWPSWQSKSGCYLAVPDKQQVHMYTRGNWQLSQSFSEEKVKNPFTIAAFSPCGRLLAACSVIGDICIWNIEKKTCISCTEHYQGYRICSLAWNPNGKGEIAFCDVTGQLGTVEDCLPTAEEAAPNKESKDSNQTSNALDFNPLFEDEDGDNAISLQKIKDSVSHPGINDGDGDLQDLFGKDDDDDDDDDASKASEVIQEVASVSVQAPFQPTSTPVHLQHRFMLWNSVGIVRAFNTSEENSLDVEFHDSSLHHALHINNYLKHTMASLSEQALVLACEAQDDTPSKVVCVLLNSWDGTKEWSIDLPEAEEVLAVATSGHWLAVATDVRNLRLFTVGGTQREVASLPGPVVCLAPQKDKLMAVYHSGPGLYFTVFCVNYNDLEVVTPSQPLPTTPQSTLKWVGFSDEGSPCITDSAGIVRIFSSRGYWQPACDTQAQCKGKSDHYFVLGISERYQNIRCILCKGSYYPQTTPRPPVTEIPLKLPLCDATNEKTVLEETFWRAHFIYGSLDEVSKIDPTYVTDKETVDKLMKETIIKLFALACRNGLEHRAVDLCWLMPSYQVVQLAEKYASKLGKMHLAKRLSDIVSYKKKENQLVMSHQYDSHESRLMNHIQSTSDSERIVSRSNNVNDDPDLFADSQENAMSPVSEPPNLLLAAKNKMSITPEIQPSQKRINPFMKKDSSGVVKKGLEKLDSPVANGNKSKIVNGTAGQGKPSVTPPAAAKTKQSGLWGKFPNIGSPSMTFVQWFSQEKASLQVEFPNSSPSELARQGMKRFKEEMAKEKQNAAEVANGESAEGSSAQKETNAKRNEGNMHNTEAEHFPAEARKRKLDDDKSGKENTKKSLSTVQKLSCFSFNKS